MTPFAEDLSNEGRGQSTEKQVALQAEIEYL